jgi:uncharacterized membrane protein
MTKLAEQTKIPSQSLTGLHELVHRNRRRTAEGVTFRASDPCSGRKERASDPSAGGGVVGAGGGRGTGTEGGFTVPGGRPAWPSSS